MDVKMTAWDTAFLAMFKKKSILMRRRMMMLMLLVVKNQQPAKPIVLQGNKSKVRRRKLAVLRTAAKKQLFGLSKGPKEKVRECLGLA